MSGRIHKSKGLDVLIRALPLIAREVDDFIAIIAGGGSEARKWAQQFIWNKILPRHKKLYKRLLT
jgi:glycosyltransferase involved in cell wall biosynthesis